MHCANRGEGETDPSSSSITLAVFLALGTNLSLEKPSSFPFSAGARLLPATAFPAGTEEEASVPNLRFAGPGTIASGAGAGEADAEAEAEEAMAGRRALGREEAAGMILEFLLLDSLLYLLEDCALFGGARE